MPLLMPLVLAALLFSLGIYGVLARRNAVLVLMAVELMLNAVNLNLVAFDVWLRDTLHSGQTFTLFVIAIAAAEVGVGLAIVLQVFRLRGTVAVDEVADLAEHPGEPAGAPPAVPPPTDHPAAGAPPAGGPPAGPARAPQPLPAERTA